jgi:hypothetical protein
MLMIGAVEAAREAGFIQQGQGVVGYQGAWP